MSEESKIEMEVRTHAPVKTIYTSTKIQIHQRKCDNYVYVNSILTDYKTKGFNRFKVLVHVKDKLAELKERDETPFFLVKKGSLKGKFIHEYLLSDLIAYGCPSEATKYNEFVQKTSEEREEIEREESETSNQIEEEYDNADFVMNSGKEEEKKNALTVVNPSSNSLMSNNAFTTSSFVPDFSMLGKEVAFKWMELEAKKVDAFVHVQDNLLQFRREDAEANRKHARDNAEADRTLAKNNAEADRLHATKAQNKRIMFDVKKLETDVSVKKARLETEDEKIAFKRNQLAQKQLDKEAAKKKSEEFTVLSTGEEGYEIPLGVRLNAKEKKKAEDRLEFHRQQAAMGIMENY